MCRKVETDGGFCSLEDNIQYFHEEFQTGQCSCVLVADDESKLDFGILISFEQMIWSLRRWRLIICFITNIDHVSIGGGGVALSSPSNISVKQERSAFL